MAETLVAPTGLYTTVSGCHELQIFHDKVSLLLADGWSCAGGQIRDHHGNFFQAMFRAPPAAPGVAATSVDKEDSETKKFNFVSTAPVDKEDSETKKFNFVSTVPDDAGRRNLKAALAKSYVDIAVLKAAVAERDAEIVGLKGKAAAKLQEKKKEILGILEEYQRDLRQIEAEEAAASE